MVEDARRGKEEEEEEEEGKERENRLAPNKYQRARRVPCWKFQFYCFTLYHCEL